MFLRTTAEIASDLERMAGGKRPLMKSIREAAKGMVGPRPQPKQFYEGGTLTAGDYSFGMGDEELPWWRRPMSVNLPPMPQATATAEAYNEAPPPLPPPDVVAAPSGQGYTPDAVAEAYSEPVAPSRAPDIPAPAPRRESFLTSVATAANEAVGVLQQPVQAAARAVERFQPFETLVDAAAMPLGGNGGAEAATVQPLTETRPELEALAQNVGEMARDVASPLDALGGATYTLPDGRVVGKPYSETVGQVAEALIPRSVAEAGGGVAPGLDDAVRLAAGRGLSRLARATTPGADLAGARFLSGIGPATDYDEDVLRLIGALEEPATAGPARAAAELADSGRVVADVRTADLKRELSALEDLGYSNLNLQGTTEPRPAFEGLSERQRQRYNEVSDEVARRMGTPTTAQRTAAAQVADLPKTPQYAQLRTKLNREAKDPTAGLPSNERRVLTNAAGEKFVTGRITFEDWLERVETQITPGEWADSRYWYEQFQDMVGNLPVEDQARMAEAWLRSQVQARPSQGMQNVLRSEDIALGGRPRGVAPQAGLVYKQLERVLKGEEATGGAGQKILDFIDSARLSATRRWMGNHELGGAPAVIDVWSGRDTGLIDEEVLGALTKKFGPEQVAGLQLDIGKGGPPAPMYENRAQFLRDVTDRLNELGVDGGNWKPHQVQAIGWMATQKALGGTPETVADIMGKNIRTLNFELNFAEGSPLSGQLKGISPGGQRAVANEVLGNIATWVEQNIPGARIVNKVPRIGGWRDEVSPAYEIQVFASPETAQDIADVVGYMAQQQEVWVSRPMPSGKSRFVDIDLPGLEGGQAGFTRIYDALRADSPELFTGFTSQEGGMRIVLDVKGAQMKKVQAAIQRVSDQLNLPDGTITEGTLDLAKHTNDWRLKPDGQDYLEALQARRPGLQTTLYDSSGTRDEWVRSAVERARAADVESGYGTAARYSATPSRTTGGVASARGPGGRPPEGGPAPGSTTPPTGSLPTGSRLTAKALAGVSDEYLASLNPTTPGATRLVEAERAKRAAQPPAPRPMGDPGTFAGNIRLEKYPQEIGDYIAASADARAAEIEAARRGVRSIEQTTEDARTLVNDIGGNFEKLQKSWKPGEAWNAEEIVAIRGALADSVDDVFAKSEALGEAPTSIELQEALGAAIIRHQELQKIVYGVTAEAGRALRQFRESAAQALREGDTGRRQELLAHALKLRRSVKGGDVDAHMAELVKAIRSMDVNDPQAVNRFLRDVAKPDAWDYLMELRYFNMLSHPYTYVRNILGNLGAGLTQPLERGVAAGLDLGISTVTGRPRERFFSEVPAAIVGGVRGIPEGVESMLRIMKHGYDPFATGRLDYRRQAFGGKFGRVIRTPTNIMEALDALFYGWAYRSHLNANAVRQAKREGLKGDYYTARVAELLTNAPTSMVKAASDMADTQLFRGDPGKFANALMNMRSQFPMLQVLLPFVRTPANLLRYGIRRSPLGLLDYKSYQKIMQKNPEGQDEIARSLVGSGIVASFAALSATGQIDMTAQAPSDPIERDRFYREGKIPYAIKIPGVGWVAYRQLEPFNIPLTLTAQAIQTAREGGDPVDMITQATTALAQGFVSQTYMSGLSDLVESLNAYDPSKNLGRFAARTAGSFIPASSALRGVTAFTDPYIRETDMPLDVIQAGIPGLSDNLPVRLNAFGEPIERGLQGKLPIQASAPNPNKVDEELGRLGERVGFTGRSVGGQPLNEEQQRLYQQASGQMVKAFLTGIVNDPEYDAQSDFDKAWLLEEAIRLARNAVRDPFGDFEKEEWQALSPEGRNELIETLLNEGLQKAQEFAR